MALPREEVDHEFEYKSNANEVCLTGSFLDWNDSILMQKDDNSNIFRVTVPLKLGIHHYKFIADGNWEYSSTEPTMVDLDGNVNNCIVIKRNTTEVPKENIPKEWNYKPPPLTLLPKVAKKNILHNQLMLPGVKEIPSPRREIKPAAIRGYESEVEQVRDQKLLLVTVGLPARGKSFIAQKLSRYLYWLGFSSKILSTDSYRQKLLGAFHSYEWYDPDNYKAADSRNKITKTALDDAFKWFTEEHGIVAILDGNNCSKEERDLIIQKVKCQKPSINIRIIFLEIIVNDKEEVESNIVRSFLSPDYVGLDHDSIRKDMNEKIKIHRRMYEPVEDSRHYIRVFDGGEQLVMNRVNGFLPSKIMFYLSNLRTTEKHIYFVRHGESEYNVNKLIGGDPDLTPRGYLFAKQLSDWITKNIPDAKDKLSVWCSTMKRSIETAEGLPCRQYIRWKVLDEIEAGICDSMTYEEIEEKYPEEYEARQKDKLRYRYPRGESYEDLIRRVEPVIVELERRDTPVLIVAHQAILRCMYAYFKDFPREKVPYISFPSECVVKLTPQAFGTVEERFYLTSNSHQ